MLQVDIIRGRSMPPNLFDHKASHLVNTVNTVLLTNEIGVSSRKPFLKCDPLYKKDAFQ